MDRLRRIFGFSISLYLALALSAAGQHSSSSGTAPKTLPPAATLTENDNGKDIDLTTSETLIVKLKSNPSTGYSWVVKGNPSPLRLEKSTYRKGGGSAQKAGAPGVQVLRLSASTVGLATLNLEYRRPWEYNMPPAKTFTVRVDVR